MTIGFMVNRLHGKNIYSAVPGREERVDLAQAALCYGEGRHMNDTDGWFRVASLTRFVLWKVSLAY